MTDTCAYCKCPITDIETIATAGGRDYHIACWRHKRREETSMPNPSTACDKSGHQPCPECDPQIPRTGGAGAGGLPARAAVAPLTPEDFIAALENTVHGRVVNEPAAAAPQPVPSPAAELIQRHMDLCYRARDIMVAKNHDYRGGSGDPFANFRGSTSLGIDPIVGILLRMQDKMMRIKTFAEKGQLKVKG